MQTVGDRIGLSASHSQCQECSCELDENGAAVSVCRRCDLEPFYMKVSVYVKGTLLFILYFVVIIYNDSPRGTIMILTF